MSRTSFSEKTMPSSLYLGIFKGRNHECTLFTSLAYAFFRYLKDPSTTNPLEIIIISPMGVLLPPISSFFSFSSLFCLLYGSVFCTNFCNFSWQINISTWSFRCLHFQCDARGPGETCITCFCFLLRLGSIGLGHYRASSSFICINTCSIGITRGVKLVNLGLRSRKFFFLSNASLVPCVSLFLLGLWLVLSSIFLLVVTPLAIIASLHSYIFGPCEVILLPFSTDSWWLRRRNLLVAILLGRSLGWLDLPLCPPIANLYWSASHIALAILPLLGVCWEDALLASCVIVLQWNDKQNPCWVARSSQ